MAKPRKPIHQGRRVAGAVSILLACLLGSAEGASTMVVSLDGKWLLATDPQNVGREQQWFQAPRPEAKETTVPWIIQDAFPNTHGVAWYWREFDAPANPHAQGRYLLRFWQVDYAAEGWLNGVRIGEHEGAESPFVFDVTHTVKPGRTNRLAVRVLNPTNEPIDGIVLKQTPHRNKAIPYWAGASWNHGGIVDSVELLVVPAVRVTDLFVRPDWKTGNIRVQATIHNAGEAVRGHLELAIAPAATGATVCLVKPTRELPPGDSAVELDLHVPEHRLWQLNDPFLYRVTARVEAEGSASVDEHSVRCGFRDFRFAGGAFRLNGRRIYLRCSHTGNHCPIGLELPHDPDILRRDLLNVKAMGFNAIRFIAGVAKRYQLDLCDELGLLAYEETYAAWLLDNSPHMARRYDESVLAMIRRDRNHPSIVIWGLLNETNEGPVFRHAVGFLPKVRQLDDSRMVMLNSGRWDLPHGSLAGLQAWHHTDLIDPNVSRNPTGHVLQGLGITWQPGQLSFHPGAKGEYSIVRWTAPEAGKVEVSAAFAGIAGKATTDVHVLHNRAVLFDAYINVQGGGNDAQFAKTLAVAKGDTIDCAVGFGNGNYGGDTTALAVAIKATDGKVHDAAAEFSAEHNPNGAWSYGTLAPGAAPDAATFKPYAQGVAVESIGSLSNPGSSVWEDVLHDQHPYPRVPHTADTIAMLRSMSGNGKPVFISEYGIGSAVHLPRVVRLYEQIGKGEADDAAYYRAQRDAFLADWTRWRLDEAFASPDDYFAQCLEKMAGQRLLGLNAIRANPHCIGHSLTGTVDQGMTGEGLTTTFRELKPGTVDALFDGFAPLRWCLFAEPVNVYRKAKVRLEAVLAKEDALLPGEYPVHVQVVGPDMRRVLERKITVAIPKRQDDDEPPFALPVFAEDVVIDGPSGAYRFLATFERGAAASGGEAVFHVADPADMPRVETEATLWGNDAELAKWLADHGIRTRPFAAQAPAAREAILIGRGAPNGAEAWRELARRIARGSTAIFLCQEVFRKGDDPVGWVPLKGKGALDARRSWLYLKDEWAKRHPIFDGLPAGGLLDTAFYREIIPDHVWAGQEPPAEAVAGAINAAQAYWSGLLVAVHKLGAGRFVVNTMRVSEELGRHPAAERLLRNMLRYAARDAGKPLADLPADFDATLKALGYQ